ncbi:MAG: DegV family protein [Anaerolineaceae bacterium]
MKIVTDSGSDLSMEQCQVLGVTMLPLKVQLGGKTYLSGVDLSPEEFYDLIEHTDEMPTTSTPSVGDFVEVYKRLGKEDADILSIHLSSGLSGTYSAAVTASKLVKQNVTLVDTLTLSAGTGWQVEAAAQAAKANLPLNVILEKLKQIQAATNVFFTLPDLKYLIAGGRISHLKGLLASLLGITPIITVNKQDGKYYDKSKKRSYQKAIQAIPELILENHPEGTELRAQICHAANLEGGNLLKQAMESVFKCEWLPDCSIGTALGAHTGRGLVGIMHAAKADYPSIP